MTYPKRLTKKAQTVIGPILTQIHAMQPGDLLEFKGKSDKHTAQARGFLYGYISLYDLKGRYTLRRVAGNRLQVICNDDAPMELVELKGNRGDAIQEFYFQYLHNISDEDEAREIVRTQNAMGVCSDQAVSLILAEWTRQQA